MPASAIDHSFVLVGTRPAQRDSAEPANDNGLDWLSGLARSQPTIAGLGDREPRLGNGLNLIGVVTGCLIVAWAYVLVQSLFGLECLLR